MIDSLRWTFTDPVSIPESVAIAPVSDSAWVGEQLNNERLQHFQISGSGTPDFEVPGTHVIGNPAAVAAAHTTDLAVFMDFTSMSGPFVVTAYHSGSATPIWTYTVGASYTAGGPHSLKVSRDGSTVLLGVGDPTTNTPVLITLDGATGAERSRWAGANGLIYGVDCTDDGSLAIVAQGDPPAGTGRLIHTADGSLVTTFNGNGAGGWYNISGNGDVIVIGGFDFRVFVRSGSMYTQHITFNAPSSWFSWGSAVSRDGTTVGALSHDYGSGYLNTAVRIWDVASGQLLGTATTTGSGSLQDSAVYGVMSDDGSRFAVASWGDQGNSHPQVRLFDRNVNLVDSLTTTGSPFALDLSGNGQYMLVGDKSVHANTFGNGGDVFLVQEGSTGPTCYANCDQSTTVPFLNVNDFICFQSKFAAGDTYANCDQSTIPPVLNVNDFVCFQTKFAAGCSAP